MPHDINPQGLDLARELLSKSRPILVLTGAGISADSGLATFRGADGLWRNYRAQELATPEAFSRDPRLVWEWYGMRREKAAACAPNEAHLALARLAAESDGVTIATQNVDGLHTRAAEQVAAADVGAGTKEQGKDPSILLELHGCLFRVRCTRCDERYEHRESIDAGSAVSLPSCRACSSLLRPDIVWFGEPLGEAIEVAFTRAQQAAVCLVVGTSAVVQPAASIATVVDRGGGSVIEVNPEPTPLTPLAAVSLRSGAAEVVPLLLG